MYQRKRKTKLKRSFYFYLFPAGLYMKHIRKEEESWH
jgi:hypothetical protein